MEMETNSRAWAGCEPDCTPAPEAGCKPALVSDRRVHPRVEIDTAATMQLVGRDLAVQGRITDLGQQGCRLRARRHFASGSRVEVEVLFRVNGIAFRRGGVTEWSDGWSTIGIRFTDVPARRAAELAEVIAEVQAENRARSVQQARSEWAARLRDGEASEPVEQLM
jgi:hypothetical protein